MAQAPIELLLLLGPGAHEVLCVSFKSEVCISPRPLEFPKLSLAGLQSQMLLRFIFPGQDPQAEETDMRLRTVLWQNLCNIITLWFVGHPLGGMGVDYITSMSLLPILIVVFPSLCLYLQIFSENRWFKIIFSHPIGCFLLS